MSWLKKIATITTLLLVATVLLLTATAFGQPSNVKMPNGDYNPGAVLVYRGGTLEVATPAKIDRSETTYVLIHGAHTNSSNEKLNKLARAIKKEDSDANVLMVDWGYWAGLSEDRIADIIGEKIIEAAIETFWRDVLGGEEVDYDELMERHLTELLQRLLLNILPVEQTNYIPSVADRVYTLLFESSGTNWNITTNTTTSTFVSLGLNPRKVHLIGHSHGAHVAGLTAAKCRSKLSKRPERLTAIEPSNSELHVSGQNYSGDGWDRNVADCVVVVSTTEICCGDKLYGDLNVHFYSSERKHPIAHPEDWGDPISFVGDLLKTELTLHSAAIDLVTSLVEDDDYLTDEPDEDDFLPDEWISIDVDDD